MKMKPEFFKLLVILLLVLLGSFTGLQTVKACEACNRLFLVQLQGEEREGSLVSKELLAAIAAQRHIGRNNPALLTDGLSNNTLVADNQVQASTNGQPGAAVQIVNAGPNLFATFHIVGIIWDYAYWQGHPENRFTGGQSITAGPSDSWVVEFRIPPDEGSYLMLSHSVGSTDRGAIGLLICDRDAQPNKTFLSDGIKYSEEQMAEYREKALRTITPFGIGSSDVDRPVVYGPETKEVIVKIIGNSYHPKIIQVSPGTTIKWINEDVFTYMEGEFSGIHNVLVRTGPDRFYSPMLAHAETFSHMVEQEGEYTYICTPHPYMEGKIIVAKDSGIGNTQYVMAGSGPPGKMVWVALIIAAFALMIGIISLINK